MRRPRLFGPVWLTSTALAAGGALAVWMWTRWGYAVRSTQRSVRMAPNPPIHTHESPPGGREIQSEAEGKGPRFHRTYSVTLKDATLTPDVDWRVYQDRLDAIRSASVNFDREAHHERTVENGWSIDRHEVELPSEPSGPPRADGPWEIACDLVRAYAFPDPSLIRGIFSPEVPIAGRPMLLKARFLGFTFWFGVRLTEEVDTIRETETGPVRVWGYGYYTLEGHFERGQIEFEVRKDMKSGRVSFHIEAVSQPDRISNPFYRIGFKLFGRRLQLRFARTALKRMQRLTTETLAANQARHETNLATRQISPPGSRNLSHPMPKTPFTLSPPTHEITAPSDGAGRPDARPRTAPS
ncbi:MAG: DUF1990 domain-containing protein [Bacteroidota bacterium]